MSRPFHSGLWLLVLLTSIQSAAQREPISFAHFTTINGLGHNTVTSIVQDEQGYIRIGTHYGLATYDGRIFRNALHNSRPGSLPNNLIVGMRKLEHSRLAILTNEGVQIQNTLTGKTINCAIPDSGVFFLYLNKTWDIIALADKGYFVSTVTGFYLFDTLGKLNWRFDAFKREDVGKAMRYGRELIRLSADEILCFYEETHSASVFHIGNRQLRKVTRDNHGYLLPLVNRRWLNVATRNYKDYFFSGNGSDSLCHFNTATRKITTSHSAPLAARELTWPSKLIVINDTLLVNTSPNGGYFYLHFNRGTNHLTSDTQRQMPGILCNNVLRDNSGRWWLGTEQGLYMQQFLQPTVRFFDITPHVKSWIETPVVHDVYKDGDLIYFCAGVKDGVTIIDAKDNSYKLNIRYPCSLKKEWNDIYFIHPVGADTLLFGSRIGLGWYSRKRKTLDTLFYLNAGVTYFANEKSIWFNVLSSSPKFIHYDKVMRTFTVNPDSSMAASCPLTHLKYITEDSYGNIWCAGHGMARYNMQKRIWDTVIKTFAGPRKLEDNVQFLNGDDNGNIWLSTSMNGLLKYSIARKKFSHYGAANGLSSDWVYSMSSLIHGRYFISTNIQLDVLDPAANVVTGINYKDGLPDTKKNSRAIL